MNKVGINGIIYPSKLALWPVARGRYLALVAKRIVPSPPSLSEHPVRKLPAATGGVAPEGASQAYYEHLVDEYGEERVRAWLKEKGNG